MLTRNLTRTFPQLTKATTSAPRAFSAIARKMAEGDTGAPRSGGQSQGDAFTKREQASEDYAIRQREKEKLEQLRQKIADKEAELAKHRFEAEEILKKSSG